MSSRGEQVGGVSGTTPHFTIDLQLELEDQSRNNTLASTSVNRKQGSILRKLLASDDQAHPTTYNPLYGFVEGAKHGSTEWSMFKIL
jgi:hypothetical protein